jgi:hypothetical protein
MKLHSLYHIPQIFSIFIKRNQNFRENIKNQIEIIEQSSTENRTIQKNAGHQQM